MINLRIQELLDARDLSRTDLSSLTGISEDVITKYAVESINLREDTAQDIRVIATQLDTPVEDLIQQVDENPGVRLRISEYAAAQGLNLTQIANSANVNLYVLAIYSTQVLLKEKYEEPKIQAELSRIANTLGTSLVELSDSSEVPINRISLGTFLQRKGTSLGDLSLLYDVPSDLFELLDGQPFDPSLFRSYGITEDTINTYAAEPSTLSSLVRFLCCVARICC